MWRSINGEAISLMYSLGEDSMQGLFALVFILTLRQATDDVEVRPKVADPLKSESDRYEPQVPASELAYLPGFEQAKQAACLVAPYDRVGRVLQKLVDLARQRVDEQDCKQSGATTVSGRAGV